MNILITGASSGIGFDAAAELARLGHTVFAAARRVALMEPLREFGVTPVALDVTSEESIDACLAVTGPLDVLVNCAGYGSFGAIETVPLEEARRQMEVNLFGLAALCKKVLPYMRERRSGRIINISSVAGKACLYFGGWYHVSKYAVEAFSDTLRMEMKPFGVDVVLIEPGATRTDWGIIADDHLQDTGQAVRGYPRHRQGRESTAPPRPLPRCHRRHRHCVLAWHPPHPLVGRRREAVRLPLACQGSGEVVGGGWLWQWLWLRLRLRLPG